MFSSLVAEPGKLPLEASSLSLRNYIDVFTDAATYRVLTDTVIFTIGATALGTTLAIVFAWLIERTDLWGRNVLRIIIVVPMAVPNMIYTSAWILLLNPQNGWLKSTLDTTGLGFLAFNIYSLGGMIFVQGLILASNAYLLVAAPLKMIDPSWEEQSAICGRGTLSTLWRIAAPLVKPALLAAAIFFAIVSLETFEVPGTLGLPANVQVLSTRIYWAAMPEVSSIPNYGVASTISMLILAVALVLIVIYQRQTRNARQFVTITGKGFRPKRIGLRRFRLLASLCAWAVVLTIVVLPLLMLVWRSLIPFYVPPSFGALKAVSVDAYVELFTSYNVSSVLQNTVLMSVTAAVTTTLLASLVAWMVLRAPVNAFWRNSLNKLSFLPIAVPSIVVGLCFMVVYLSLPFAIYGTIWGMAIAMVVRYLAFTSGMMMAAQVQISRELEEASHVAGAGWMTTYRRVTLPLLTGALVNCFLWVVIHVTRELSVSVMLFNPRSEVLSTKVWSLWQGGWVAHASALGVLTVLVLAVLMSVPLLVTGVKAKLSRANS